IAKYYQVETSYLLDVYAIHHEEIGEVEEKWTPRAAIRIGLLLNSPIASAVRSLALDVIEAYKQPTKRTSIRFLLENTQFVEWSDVTIARILECSRTEVGKIRKELEASGNILQFKKRKHVREGKEVERENEGSSLLTVGTDSERHSNPDSTVTKVRISSQLHDRFEQEGVIVKEKEGHWQKVIRFDDGKEVAFADTDFEILNPPSTQIEEEFAPDELTPSASEIIPPVERKYPKEYEEAIAQLKLQHQQEIEQLEQQLRVGIQSDAEARAIAQVHEKLAASQSLASARALEVAKLQQQIEKLESLRSLEVENKQLLSRIRELERALEKRPAQEWGSTLTKQAEKALNLNTIKMVEALEPEFHLRSLAVSPPSDANEAMRLMVLAMGNLAQAINSTQLLSAAAVLLKCHPTAEAIAIQTQVYQAAYEIRNAIADGCRWEDFWAIAQRYTAIKPHYWRELTADEKNFITKLKQDFDSAKEPI
ncbi:MAG: hypothetical protein AB1589_43680, partial [Cyanobacteriota bacterium]